MDPTSHEPAGGESSPTAAEPESALAERVARLESVNEGLRALLAHERAVMTAELERAAAAAPAPDDRRAEYRAARMEHELQEARAELAATRDRLVAATAEQDRLRAEIDRIYSTRTMRVLRPLRGLYRRARTLLE